MEKKLEHERLRPILLVASCIRHFEKVLRDTCSVINTLPSHAFGFSAIVGARGSVEVPVQSKASSVFVIIVVSDGRCRSDSSHDTCTMKKREDECSH